MTVRAKLSGRFYERLGDEIANELVDWFNRVDAAYKSDLRDVNEANFVRFDAKLEQRLAEHREAVTSRIDRLEVLLERSLKEQTRFYFLAWAVLLASNIALWFRG
jgi:hypothetical protein